MEYLSKAFNAINSSIGCSAGVPTKQATELKKGCASAFSPFSSYLGTPPVVVPRTLESAVRDAALTWTGRDVVALHETISSEQEQFFCSKHLFRTPFYNPKNRPRIGCLLEL